MYAVHVLDIILNLKHVVESVWVVFFQVYVSSHGDNWKTTGAEYETSSVRRQYRSKQCLQRHLDTLQEEE